MKRLRIGILFLVVATNGFAQEEKDETPVNQDQQTSSAEADAERDWRVGPSLNIAILPPSIGIDATYGKQFSGGFHVGSLPYSADKVDLTFQSWDLVGRWHPWFGSFFVGMGYASQKIGITAEDNIDDNLGTKVATKLTTGVQTNYLMPHLGWMAVWDSGFTLGFEIGYKLHLNHSVDKVEASFHGATPAQVAAVTGTEEYKKQAKDVDDAMDAFGKASLPYVNLLKIGYLF